MQQGLRSGTVTMRKRGLTDVQWWGIVIPVFHMLGAAFIIVLYIFAATSVYDEMTPLLLSSVGFIPAAIFFASSIGIRSETGSKRRRPVEHSTEALWVAIPTYIITLGLSIWATVRLFKDSASLLVYLTAIYFVLLHIIGTVASISIMSYIASYNNAFNDANFSSLASPATPEEVNVGDQVGSRSAPFTPSNNRTTWVSSRSRM